MVFEVKVVVAVHDVAHAVVERAQQYLHMAASLRRVKLLQHLILCSGVFLIYFVFVNVDPYLSGAVAEHDLTRNECWMRVRNKHVGIRLHVMDDRLAMQENRQARVVHRRGFDHSQSVHLGILVMEHENARVLIVADAKALVLVIKVIQLARYARQVQRERHVHVIDRELHVFAAHLVHSDHRVH